MALYAMSPASSSESANVEFIPWWIKDLDDPDNNTTIDVHDTGDLDISRSQDTHVFSPLSRSDYIVVSDVIRNARFNLVADFLGIDSWTEFEGLRATKKTLLLQAPMQGLQWYFRFGPTYDITVLNVESAYRRIAFEVVEVETP